MERLGRFSGNFYGGGGLGLVELVFKISLVDLRGQIRRPHEQITGREIDLKPAAHMRKMLYPAPGSIRANSSQTQK